MSRCSYRSIAGREYRHDLGVAWTAERWQLANIHGRRLKMRAFLLAQFKFRMFTILTIFNIDIIRANSIDYHYIAPSTKGMGQRFCPRRDYPDGHRTFRFCPLGSW